MKIIVSTFYKFTAIKDVNQLKNKFLKIGKDLNLLGTIILAEEGFNATISGLREDMNTFYRYMENELGYRDIFYKETVTEHSTFRKWKIKVRPEIVTADMPTHNTPGQYIAPEQWDDFIAREDVVVIDTRNDYEYALGSFNKAINPDIENFKQFKTWMDDNLNSYKGKKVAMFCTFGIRCEKSTAYAKDILGEDVYHLEGGIGNYLIKTKNHKKQWQGQCFVFDERLVIDENSL